jgi:hypothetical protein
MYPFIINKNSKAIIAPDDIKKLYPSYQKLRLISLQKTKYSPKVMKPHP